MKQETVALENNGTQELTQLPTGKRALGCKWVYKIKHKADDFIETFAPIAKMVTVQTTLSVLPPGTSQSIRWIFHNAFRHGDLYEEVYMCPPSGFYL